MSENDAKFKTMTESPIPGLVIKLGIPTTISMLVTNIYNLADTYFVSQLGTSASGAVGIVFGYMIVLQAIGFLFGSGAGSLISRCLGNRDEESASKYATMALALTIGVSAIVGAFSSFFLDPFIMFLGSTPTILPYARIYILCIIFSSPFMVSTFVLNNILRYEGRANLAMIGLVSGALLNMIGDPILIFYFKMGVLGAGISTALSQVVSFGILISFFIFRKTQSRISIKNLSFEPQRAFDIVAIGFPALARQGLQSISTMLLNNCAAVYGDAAVAGMSIVSRVSFMVFAVGLGIGQGYQPICGFNYGARLYSRVKQALRFTLGLGEILLGVFAVIIFMIAPQLIVLFRDDPAVIAVGVTALRLQCVGLLFQPLGVMANMTFQSAGRAVAATVSSIFKSGVFFIPILIAGAKLFGLIGIQAAQPISDMITFFATLPMLIYFLRRLPADGEEAK